MFYSRKWALFVLLNLWLTVSLQSQPKTSNAWLFTELNFPSNPLQKPVRQVVVAVIDDGFRFSHKDLKGFLYSNHHELPGNNIDDDNNGYIDDVNGWDISDNDNDVSLPGGREDEFYHGTAVAGIIINMVRNAYGDEASYYFKILPVKVLSSSAGNTAILDGYKGIKYALSLSPDIICCAWSGGTPRNDEIALFTEARKKGILVIASSGNMFSEKDEYPARIEGVWDIAAVDTASRKLNTSNYSPRIDWALPGSNIKAPHPIAENSYFIPEGTSVATAVMTGCAAIVKLAHPSANPVLLDEAFKNTAHPIDAINIRYCGKLGAGIPDVAKTLDYLVNPDKRYSLQNKNLTKGTLVFNPLLKKQVIKVEPAGAYAGYFLNPVLVDPKFKGTIRIFNTDTLLYSQSLSALNKAFFISGSNFSVEVNAPKKTLQQFKLKYYPKTIDSTTLFCKDISYYSGKSGVITDGSGTNNYSSFCSCKWQITAPAGKRIKIWFTEFDTQAKTDFVWLFDGESTIPENIIAKFSGPNIPPEVTSASHKVLVWFVTDGFVTGKGWKLNYEVED